MAEVEFGSTSSPLRTWSDARSASSAGDSLLISGDERHPSSHFSFDIDRIIGSTAYRGGTFLPNASETTRTFRTSSSLAAANNPHIMREFNVNGEDATQYAVELVQDATEDLELELSGVYAYNGTTYAIFNRMRRGVQYFSDIKVGGSPSGSYFKTSSLAGDGDQTLIINGMDLSECEYSASQDVIDLEKVNNLTNTLTMSISGLRGTVTATGSASVICLDARGANTVDVSGCTHTLSSGDTATGGYCILVRGNTVAVTANARVIGNNCKFESPAGYGIGFGLATSASDITAGGVYGNTLTGKYYASSTPHLFMMGEGTNGDCFGNIAIDGYVPFLISKTTDCNVRGCLAFDGYGPNYYVKGATNATLTDNVAVLTGKFTQRANGILAVAPQGATNTAACTIQNNVVIVNDISKIHSLAQIVDASQTATFSRNIYFVVADDVDLTTDQLFAYQSTTPNNTIAQWNTNTSANDRVITVTQEQMDSMISKYAAFKSGTGIGFRNIVSRLVA